MEPEGAVETGVHTAEVVAVGLLPVEVIFATVPCAGVVTAPCAEVVTAPASTSPLSLDHD